MRILSLTLALVALGVPAAVAQQSSGPFDVTPRYDVEVGYSYIHANALPGGCDCFSLNGGFVSGGYYLNNWLSIAGQFTGQHSGSSSDGLTLLTFLAGPRVEYAKNRYVPYAQVLFGGARGSNSYFPTSPTNFETSATNWAFSPGGGLDINLTHRIAIRAIDVQYLRTNLPNGAGDIQNSLQLGTGVRFNFGNRERYVAAARPSAEDISFSCSTNTPTVVAGDPVVISGNAATQPDGMPLDYAWTSTAGAIEGTGRRVTINTAGLAPGNYDVTGHAMKTGNPAVNANCNTAFRVTYGPPQVGCLANPSRVTAGDPSTITAQPAATNAPSTIYSFITNGGTLQQNDKTAALDTTGLPPGTVTVHCRAVDGEGRLADSSANVDIIPPVAKPKTVQLCSVSFKRYANRPTRVDNEAKACLDQVALSLKHSPESHLLLVGSFSGSKDNTQAMARLRTRNAKTYLTTEQGIDPNRVEMRVSSEGAEKSVAAYLIDEGDADNPVESAPAATPPNNN